MTGTGLRGRESWEVPRPPVTKWDSTASSVKGTNDTPLRVAMNR